MTALRQDERIVLAIAPNARGFGYVAFEGPQCPLDWGVKEIRGRNNDEVRARVSELIDWFQPDVLLLKRDNASALRQSRRTRHLVPSLERMAERCCIDVWTFSRQDIRNRFALIRAVTKHEIAVAICVQLPEFDLWLPRPRKIWMSEDPRYGIFDAAALVFVFFGN